MKSIKVTIMGRQFPLKVEESDESLMFEIADFVDQRIRTYKKELANQAEPIILTLACLSMAEELYKYRRDVELNGGGSGTVTEVEADTSSLNTLLTEILDEIRH